MCASENNRLSSLLYTAMLFFVIHIFHDTSLHAMRTIGNQSYKKTYQQAKTTLYTIENAQRKRNVLIFLDDSEKDKLGPISGDLITALYQEASPIIVSSSLMCTLLEWREKNKESIQALLRELANVDWLPERYGDNWQEIIQIKERIAVCKIGFKPERWIIKVINNSLLLLIPKNYCESLGINSEKVKKYTSNIHTLSDTELRLGCKVNHMKTIEYTALHRSSLKEYFFPHYFADYFIKSLEAIFCTTSDYHKNKKEGFEWVMYIDGHGGLNDSIVYLSIDQFKQFLHFLESKIKVQLLVVSSCYVAGTNVKNVYGEIKLGTQQPNSFPIIIQGLNDVETFSSFPECDMKDWNLSHAISLKISKNFVDFFQQANKQESNYREIIKPLMLYNKHITNEPQIKMPGIEWFSVMDVDNKIVSIGTLLAKTRDPQKVLDIVSFFKKHPKIILLYTDNLPFELKIDLDTLKAIVSMVSLPTEGDLTLIINRIKKISSEKHAAVDIVKLFKLVMYTNGTQWFFIDEIHASDIWKDVVINGTSKIGMNAYFKDNNVLYKLNFKDGETKINAVQNDSADERDYNEKLTLIRNKYPELSKKMSLKNQEITAEQIKNIEEMLKKRQENN